MSKGRKRIVWVLTAVMAILIAVATSLFIGNRLKGATSNVASAETAAPASTSGDIMPASILVGSDNYHTPGVHEFTDGWDELREVDNDGNFSLAEGTKYFLKESSDVSYDRGLAFGMEGDITLCLNGLTYELPTDFEFEIGSDTVLHLCDCGDGAFIGNITVNGGTLELDGVDVQGTVTAVEGSSLKVAGNTKVGGVYLDDDVTIECGELDNDADITIEVDPDSDRGEPCVDPDSFDANNSGEDVTDYFTMSDGSNPLSYRLKVVFPAIGEGETPYEGHYGTD